MSLLFFVFVGSSSLLRFSLRLSWQSLYEIVWSQCSVASRPAIMFIETSYSTLGIVCLTFCLQFTPTFGIPSGLHRNV